MGMYVNPGNENFAEVRHGKYIDKSGLIAVVNQKIGTPVRLSCISRPRRFGKSFAAAYMTGILPIKKDGSQSAISEFREYSMIYPDEFQDYIGFSEEEVRKICEESGLDFEGAKYWYDGYSFDRIQSVYNPYAVMEARRTGEFRSYWQMSSAADSLLTYINMDFDGLSKAVTEQIGGVSRLAG